MSSGTVVRQTAIVPCVLTAGSVLAAVWFYRHVTRSQRPPAQWRPVATLKNIHLYPLKSARLAEVSAVDCTPSAIKCAKTGIYDRSFLIIDEKLGEIKSALTFPKIVLIEMTIQDKDNVTFSAPGCEDVHVNLRAKHLKPRQINNTWLETSYMGLDCGDEVAKWCSRWIYDQDTGVRIVMFNRDETSLCKRLRKNIAQTYNNIVQYLTKTTIPNYGAIVMLNEASVQDLNIHMQKISGMEVLPITFRPNFIIEGAQPYVEDFWPWIKIGEVILKNVKPNTRCRLTTIDPRTGERNRNGEPLRTLDTYRKVKDVLHEVFEAEKPIMGMHMDVYRVGRVHVNDTVYIGI